VDWPFSVYNNITDITEIPQKKALIVSPTINRNIIVHQEANGAMVTTFQTKTAHALWLYMEKS